MRIQHSTWIIHSIFVCLFATIESYPRIDISKETNIYRETEKTNILSDNHFFVAKDVCQSSVCQKTGKALKSNLNTSVDPCDDFYEFACGGWIASHTIPDDKPRYFGDDQIEDIINKKLNESLRDKRSATDSKAVVFASGLYKTCMNNATRESIGVVPLKKVMNEFSGGGGGWPIAFGSFNQTSFDWRDALATVVAQFGYYPVFSFRVSPDANNTKVNRFEFGAGTFGIGRNQLINQSQYPEIVSAYKNIILKTAVLLGAKNDSQTRQQIDEVVDFEAQLAKETLAQEESRSAEELYVWMTFQDFNDFTNNTVDWVHLINNIYSKLNSTVRVRSDELVIVTDVEYYKDIVKLMDQTPKKVIANYFGWGVATTLGMLTNQAFRTTNFQFSQVLTGALKETQLWEECVSIIASSLQYAVSRLYIETSFTKKDKEVASVIVKDIKLSFDELMRATDWLDKSTKTKALHKLNSIHQNVGYPDWILDNKQLDNYYNLTKKVDPKNFFENMVYLQQRSSIASFELLRKAVKLDTSWPMAPHIVNAAYEPTQNSITIPAGQLAPPYFDTRLPAYVNFGSIGSVVGHELTHGFDDQGSEFDANGNLRNWWTEDVSEQFDEKAECFINEYNSYIDHQTNMRLNGNNTVGENIADNGGIREAFNAYLKYEKKHGKQQRLPFINQYSAKQQFFISYANTWCTKYRTEFLKDLIEYNPHSPAKYRVNIPLANFKTFSDVFKCSANSRMNRKYKCVLW